ncbi:MAG: HNH endonuclease [Bacilli bacterium]|nr:HNH endonuclease [Bacilli bacterium]
MEDWKDIKGYEGYYQISSLGRVKSLTRVVVCKNKHKFTCREKILKLNTRNGYYVVNFQKEGLKRSFQIHRLVAIHFINNPQNKPQVNHIDGNKKNNNVNNLEWVTIKENINHAFNIGLSSKIRHNNKPVLQFDKNMNFIKEYVSACSAENETNINHSNISRCCRGIYKQTGGYIWKYKNGFQNEV